MSESKPLRVGVVGLGFMGCTHVRAYQAAAKDGLCKLVAVADKSAERLCGSAPVLGNIDTGAEGGSEQLFDPRSVRGYVDPRQLLTDPDVDVVSICTHTDTHVDLAAGALRAGGGGKHVLVEKPVATNSADVAWLAKVVAESGKLCMPGMVMRFWPGWPWLRECVRDGRYGKATSAMFQRLGSSPGWTDFYRDARRSGGAIFDLHVHDADFIRWCFGEPREVVSAGSIAHVTTIYRYGPEGPAQVVAEGAQDLDPGFGFRMRYVVVFERATVEFDLDRSPAVLVSSGGKTQAAPLPTDAPSSAYEAEVRHFLWAVREGKGNADLTATVDDAVKTTRLVEAEVRSLGTMGAERVV